MPKTKHSGYFTPLNAEFSVATEMQDVEILHVTPSRILAKGKRYGRNWLLRGLPPEKRNDITLLRQLREEFDRRFGCLEPGVPITIGMEVIEGLGPCIVEEWRDDAPVNENEDEVKKHGPILRNVGIFIMVVLVLAGSLGTGLYIRHLSVAFDTAKSDLESLRLANSQGEERILVLVDSLEKVYVNPMMSEELDESVKVKEVDEGDLIFQTLRQTKIKEFEKELERYDRQVMPQVIDDLPLFYDSLSALYYRMIDLGIDVDPTGRFHQFPEDDRIRLTNHLFGEYMRNTANYTRVWIPKARESYNARKDKVGKEEL